MAHSGGHGNRRWPAEDDGGRRCPARVDSPRAPPTAVAVVTGDIILLLVLLVPIALWVVVRWLPEQRRRQSPRSQPTGPRKRWWQP